MGSVNGRVDALTVILEALVASGEIKKSDMETFLDIHDTLIDAGVMQQY